MKSLLLFFLFLLITKNGIAQDDLPSSQKRVALIAGKEYKKSRLHQWLFGKNWRSEWATPVTVPVLDLGTIYGGLTPYAASGGGESRSLRLRSREGHEYVLRSINKWRKKGVPRILKWVGYAGLVQDGVSMSHPYGALAVPGMLGAANIYHAYPAVYFLPGQPALDTFNARYAGGLYLLEEKVAGNWNSLPRLGRFKSFLSTQEVREKLTVNNRHKANQYAFIRARLFDILVSDVDRHEGNWNWGVGDTGVIRYHPIPNDRDQVFFKHNGLLSKMAIAVTRRRLMQSFDYRIKNVKRLTLTKPDRKLDEFFANEMDREGWIAAAVSLQQSLTDSVIEQSIRQLPPQIVALSGTELTGKLQQRRNDLPKYAAAYYHTLARKAKVNGSAQKEFFEVRALSNSQAVVTVYRINGEGKKDTLPYYQRTFHPKETRRVILNGFGGDDVFRIEKGVRDLGIRVKVKKLR